MSFPFSSRGLSLRQQLPLLICLLLLSSILLYGTISYIAVRRAVMEVGRERLHSLTEQLASLFQQSAHTLAVATQNIADQKEIINYLDSDSAKNPAQAREAMEKLGKPDSLTALIELQDTHGACMLYAGREIIQRKTGLNASKEILPAKTGNSAIGKIYNTGDSMYYPVIAAVTKDKHAIGYVIRWRLFLASPKAIAQLSQLIGTRATLYFGNDDGSIWSDMIRPVSKPLLDSHDIRQTVLYNRGGNNPVIASGVPVTGTRWVLAVELSQQTILEAANRFLYWLIIIGVALVTTGIVVAWFISRNITRPLDQLMHATASLAGGDYSSLVIIDRQNELGKLAGSFNTMATQVRNVHHELEKRVQARTAELEAANKELEAFSYSVSHDLRAPLRAVSGYAVMLKEDYEATFDDEAKRILGNIVSNVKTMGKLIDDLISFSRLGKRELSQRGIIDMKALAELTVSELMLTEQEDKFRVIVCSMPDSRGDEDMIKQVWVNLIGNALKYSAKNAQPHIEIGFTGDHSETVYYVSDNGTGFDMKYYDKLFNVFQRLHSQDEFEGTGIGLALTKRIIHKHGGRIWAESVPGKGATFFFSLSVPVIENVKANHYA